MLRIFLLTLLFLLPGLRAQAEEIIEGCFAASSPAGWPLDEGVRVVALGDVGTGEGGANREVARGLREFLEARSGDPAAALLLGDNFYPAGLIGQEISCGADASPPGSKGAQVREVFGPYAFLPGLTVVHALTGNHDYGCPERGSLENQRDLDRWLDRDRRWRGRWNLLAGLPEEVFHDGRLQLIGIDSTRMIRDPEFLQKSLDVLEGFLAGSRARWRIVAGHHPLDATGFHAGHGGALHRVGRWFYPAVSFVGLGPELYGGNQTYEAEYRRYVDGLDGVFARHRVDLFLAGHEHALELLEAPGPRPPTVISGSGAKCDPITRTDRTLFGATRYGFVMLTASEESLAVDFVGTASCERRELCARPGSGDSPWDSLYRHVLPRGEPRGTKDPAANSSSSAG